MDNQVCGCVWIVRQPFAILNSVVPSVVLLGFSYNHVGDEHKDVPATGVAMMKARSCSCSEAISAKQPPDALISKAIPLILSKKTNHVED